MTEFLLITGLVVCCLLGPLYALKGTKNGNKKDST
jgi:hypothetical protein